MRKKKTFEYTSYFAAEFNGFLQYRISGGSNGLEERRVLKSLDDYLIQSGMVKKKLDGIIFECWWKHKSALCQCLPAICTLPHRIGL